MKYFNNCKTKEEAKAEFRRLAKKLHPDAGGSQEGMVELQKQYDSFEETNARFTEFQREWRSDMFQGFGNGYARTYTFNAHNNASHANQSGELQRLRDENNQLRNENYQKSLQLMSKDNSITVLSNQHHFLEMELAAIKGSFRHIRKQNDDLSAMNNELISTYPKTAWATIKHLFKLLGKPYNEYA